MPINSLINSEQIVNNSWTIRVQFVFQETIRIPNKINSCPKKMKAALMKSFMSIDGENRGKSAPKNQQFWAFFRRFDINIFNFREHFPPSNFAYSARSFSLPSPNLN